MNDWIEYEKTNGVEELHGIRPYLHDVPSRELLGFHTYLVTFQTGKDDPKTESIWLADVVLKDDGFTGRVTNVPNDLEDISYGDEVSFKREQIFKVAEEPLQEDINMIFRDYPELNSQEQGELLQEICNQRGQFRLFSILIKIN